MWVSSFNRKKTPNLGDDTAGIYAFNLSDRNRDVSKDFSHLINTNLTYRGNDRPRGLWSNGKTLWMAERDDNPGATNKIYAYDLATKERVSLQDFDKLHEAGNRAPAGLWSNGETMWVGDDADNKLYAYDLATKDRAAAKDYDTLAAAGNQHLPGLWSDGEIMWVADYEGNKVYAYNRSVEARLGSLLVTGHVDSPRYEDFVAELDPIFNSGVMDYDVSVPFATERLTLSAKTLRPHDFVLSYDPADPDLTDGYQIRLEVGQNPLVITVANGYANTNSLPRFRTYKIDVERKLFTFNDPAKDISLANSDTDENENNSDPQGVWGNAATLWVADGGR